MSIFYNLVMFFLNLGLNNEGLTSNIGLDDIKYNAIVNFLT